MDILIISSLIVLNLVVVNYELYRRNNDFEQFSLHYHRTAVAAYIWYSEKGTGLEKLAA